MSRQDHERPERRDDATSCWLPLAALLGLAALSLVARAGLAGQWPLPFCWLRKFTGIPCPACGGTRSLAAWAQFDFAAALAYNPLIFLGTLTVVAWAVLWTADRALGLRWLARAESFLEGRPVWRVLAALAVVNWVYLCLSLPR
jgi:hypothetical protein